MSFFPLGVAEIPPAFQKAEGDSERFTLFKLIVQLERTRFALQDCAPILAELAAAQVQQDQVYDVMHAISLQRADKDLMLTPRQIAMFYSEFDPVLFGEFVRGALGYQEVKGGVPLVATFRDLIELYNGWCAKGSAQALFEYFSARVRGQYDLLPRAMFQCDFEAHLQGLVSINDLPLVEWKTKDPAVLESFQLYDFMQRCFSGAAMRASVSDVQKLSYVHSEAANARAGAFLRTPSQKTFEEFARALITYLYEDRPLEIEVKKSKKAPAQKLTLLSFFDFHRQGIKPNVHAVEAEDVQVELDLIQICPPRLFPRCSKRSDDPYLEFFHTLIKAVNEPNTEHFNMLAALLQTDKVGAQYQNPAEISQLLQMDKDRRVLAERLYYVNLKANACVCVPYVGKSVSEAFGSIDLMCAFGKAVASDATPDNVELHQFMVPIKFYMIALALAAMDEADLQRNALFFQAVQLFQQIKIDVCQSAAAVPLKAIVARSPSKSALKSPGVELVSQLEAENKRLQAQISSLQAQLASASVEAALSREPAEMEQVRRSLKEAEQAMLSLLQEKDRQLIKAEAQLQAAKEHGIQNSPEEEKMQQLIQENMELKAAAAAAQAPESGQQKQVQYLQGLIQHQETLLAEKDRAIAELQIGVKPVPSQKALTTADLTDSKPQLKLGSSQGIARLADKPSKPVVSLIASRLHDAPENQQKINAFIKRNKTLDNPSATAAEPTSEQLDKIFFVIKNRESLRFLVDQSIIFSSQAVLANHELQQAILVHMSNNFGPKHSALGIGREQLQWLIANNMHIGEKGTLEAME